jgi:predicted MFS family arabinose efflux permease
MNNKIKSDFYLLLFATLFFGAASGIFMATLNNYLSDVHNLNAAARGWLEFPRELPGFLITFVAAAMLAFAREAKMAAVAMLFTGVGALGLGLVADSTVLLVVFICIWSMGDHIVFAVEGTLGLQLAQDGSEGRRLGQLGGARNLGVILGIVPIYFLAQKYGDRYDLFYIFAAACALAAGVCFYKMGVNLDKPASRRFVYKKKYGIFYAISALFGVRKQIFLAFGGWVLVQVHGVQVSTIAVLYFIAAVLGVVLRPLLGDVIDWLGERKVLAADEIFLIIVCLVYAFAGDILPKPYCVYLLFGAYIFDSVLFALRIARTTYLKKIADDPSDITPTISLGVTIDHSVAMTLPILSGYVWENFGFRWVFIIAAFIAAGGFIVCLKIRVPRMNEK